VRPKPEEYLIRTKVGTAARKVIWRADEELDLDMPRAWRISKVNDDIVVRDVSDPDGSAFYTLPVIDDETEQSFALPAARRGPGSRRPLAVEIIKLKATRPVYVTPPTPSALTTPGPRQLCAFYGQRYFLIRYRPIGQERMVKLGSLNVFQYEKAGPGFAITAAHTGLRINVGGKKASLDVGRQVFLSDVDFYRSTLVLGIHWWRFRMVPTPDGQPPLETDETEDDLREKTRLHHSTVALLSFTALFLFASYFAAKLFPPPPKVLRTEVSIKQPKVMPAFDEPKKIEPPPPPKIVEIEKPKPKPQPKKVAKEPPPAKKPERKVAQRKLAPPRKIVRAERPPPPPLQPRPPEKVVEQGPTPEQLLAAQKAKEQAAEQAQLVKSLSFLSTSKSATASDPTKYESKTGKFANQSMVGGVVSKSNALDKIQKGAPGNGTINTKSGRGVASNVKFGNRKGLNDVEGKVSEGELYSKNGNPGESLGGGKGLELSGPGELSESQIEKALAKFLSRFQYCYEKALLTDSSLGGTVAVQWTVTASGHTSDSRIVKSQLNNAELHSCVLRILGEVPFPKPKGGSVTVKKTFSFSSSSI
jgi:hypothetical protein